MNSPTDRLGRGELAGSYGGVGANASIGVGGGGNFLVGGPANAYALQPISLQGQTGLNVAAGIAGLDLEPVGLAASALAPSLTGTTTIITAKTNCIPSKKARVSGPLFCDSMCKGRNRDHAKSGKPAGYVDR